MESKNVRERGKDRKIARGKTRFRDCIPFVDDNKLIIMRSRTICKEITSKQTHMKKTKRFHYNGSKKGKGLLERTKNFTQV
jgi:predicted nucleic acid-binding protein